MRDGDMLTVQEVDRLGRNLLEGLIVLNDLFERGIAVKVLEGIAAGSTPNAASCWTWHSRWPRTVDATSCARRGTGSKRHGSGAGSAGGRV